MCYKHNLASLHVWCMLPLHIRFHRESSFYVFIHEHPFACFAKENATERNGRKKPSIDDTLDPFTEIQQRVQPGVCVVLWSSQMIYTTSNEKRIIRLLYLDNVSGVLYKQEDRVVIIILNSLFPTKSLPGIQRRRIRMLTLNFSFI